MRQIAVLLGAGLLAACQIGDGGGNGLGVSGIGGGGGQGLFAQRPAAERAETKPKRGGLLRSAPETIRVARGQVTIGGPEGYCIDRRASKRGGSASFVLLASCAPLTGAADAGPARAPGLLTASVDRLAGDIASPSAFLAFFSTEPGRAALARDGEAASVEVLEALLRDEALLMKIRDTSPVATPGLEGTYWRGLFALNGRLITVTVNAFDMRPLGRDAGRAKLTEFIARIRALSAAG